MNASTRERIDFGYAHHDARFGQIVAIRLRVRSALVCTALGALAMMLAVLTVGMGDYQLSPAQVIAALIGRGEPMEQTIVLEWRLPVAIAAILFGTLLGVGGAIFQSLTRNPLGSPDVIGFDAGSYTAVVITILFLGTAEYWAIAGAAIAGGLITAFAVYLLAYRRGVQGFRLIIVGIAAAALLGSINSYLVTRADINDAMTVGVWGAGSLARVLWESLTPSLILGVLILTAAGLLAPALRQLELGDDAALAQGVHANRTRIALLVTGVATTALVTAAAGPIGFVALAAPQLARRLARTPGVSITAAGFMGAALLPAAQYLSLLAGQLYRPIPVGLITVCVGGLYLIWLLIRETRKNL